MNIGYVHPCGSIRYGLTHTHPYAHTNTHTHKQGDASSNKCVLLCIYTLLRWANPSSHIFHESKWHTRINWNHEITHTHTLRTIASGIKWRIETIEKPNRRWWGSENGCVCCCASSDIIRRNVKMHTRNIVDTYIVVWTTLKLDWLQECIYGKLATQRNEIVFVVSGVAKSF